MPKISVIIPCYNCEKYVAECLDSVLAQTFEDWEAIVVNDGSTDGSVEILNRYAAKDSRIKIVAQKNQGPVAARNCAISLAKGKYIYPLDADDKIAPYCLEKLYSVISTTNNRVVASEVCMFGKCSEIFPQPKFTKYEMYGWHECCVISALFYKTDFEKFGAYKIDFNGYGGDDMDYWLNYIDAGLPMIRVKDVLFFYRIKTEASLWRNYSEQEMKKRTQYKEMLLLKYHPKMYFWVIFYKLIHSKLVKFFYRNSVKNSCRQIKILGITVYKSKVLFHEQK